uniref:Uncharacterized protein n=1 Tax=Brassica oleracea TaxID=3712 RepID=A0A3P6CVS6_BRAOL|nr:unnamed protein product [Brassica oleracea]
MKRTTTTIALILLWTAGLSVLLKAILSFLKKCVKKTL